MNPVDFALFRAGKQKGIHAEAKGDFPQFLWESS
jgi:hypothetical protein